MAGTEIHVSASILSADFSRLAEVIRMSEKAGIDRFHIDVMDGHFVPNISIGPVVLKALRPLTNRLLKAHLMIEHPEDYIDAFIDAGADVIAVHAECYGERRPECRAYGQYPKEVDTVDETRALRDIRKIRSRGKEACIALNPGTPVDAIEGLLDECDSILVMSVNPGFSGQKFMPGALQKIIALRAIFKGDIAVDGGVNEESAAAIVQAGANVLVTASYFYGSSNPLQVVQWLKGLSK